jgi:hypothetical protein
MIRTGCSVIRVALTLPVAAFLSASVCFATVEVYPGPGGGAYQSSLYQVEVFDGSSWISAYVYGFARLSQCHWHYGTYPTVNFLTFGTTGTVNVRVTRIAGAITSVDVSPHSKSFPSQITGGKVVLTLNPNDKAWLTINGDDANPLFLFVDPPKPAVPPGATYVGPGVHDVNAPGNHYKPLNNEIIYLDGGAWVRGNLDLRGTTGVQLIGPGILSGDLWAGEAINLLPFDQRKNYMMITGDFYGGNAASVRGITIVDSPSYNFFGGATNVHSVKLLSPWFYSTDGFQGVSHIDQSFAFVGDNVFTPMWAGTQNQNVTYTSSFVGTSNNSVFAGGYWGNAATNHYTALADDIDIKTYDNDDWVSGGAPLLAAAFQIWMDNSDPTKGFTNQTYQNIRIEGNVNEPLLELKNRLYPWDPANAPNPPLGNTYNIVFKNITLEGTQKYKSEIKGWDANNGFHNVVLDNVRINGQLVTQGNLAQHFDVNGYVWGLAVTGKARFFTVEPCRVIDTRDPPGPYGGPSIAGNTTRTVTVTGRCNIPATAVTVAANLTIVAPPTSGYVTLFPGGTPVPLFSSINFQPGLVRANNVVAPLGPSGSLGIFCSTDPSAMSNFIIDVSGYFE